MSIKLKIKCKDCKKLTTKEDYFAIEDKLCNDCVRRRKSDFMDRVRKTGKCNECHKIIEDESDKDMFNMMGVCGDCFFSFKEEPEVKKDNRIFEIRIRTGKGTKSNEEEIDNSVETILSIAQLLERKFNGISMARCKIFEDGTSLVLKR